MSSPGDEDLESQQGVQGPRTPLANVWPSFMEAWPPTLHGLSFRSVQIPLAEPDLLALISQTPEARPPLELDGRLTFSGEFRSALATALREFPAGVFLRTGSASFKSDEFLLRPIFKAELALKRLMLPHPRVARLASLCLHHHRPVSLFVREWRDIPPQSEFRLFFYGRRLVAASQYHYRDLFPEIAPAASRLAAALSAASARIAAALPMAQLVVDVAVTPSPASQEVVVIETNPFGAATHAGLFTWSEIGRGDPAFRYLAHSSSGERIESIPL
ncbi:MAG TPA: ATP-grasp domain-containing protein [Archangium sp.]|uniref:ATP-grasp domain-containing protein n=1 Tax=Archangium sp. TaxID=1872627 RepID=UPI002E300160|nr:ATP-grasp domain-containing protein [Archangium sp.]HEX5753001.1 ATP-grasp domain-containing protein [Archangium sp.]